MAFFFFLLYFNWFSASLRQFSKYLLFYLGLLIHLTNIYWESTMCWALGCTIVTYEGKQSQLLVVFLEFIVRLNAGRKGNRVRWTYETRFYLILHRLSLRETWGGGTWALIRNTRRSLLGNWGDKVPSWRGGGGWWHNVQGFRNWERASCTHKTKEWVAGLQRARRREN